MIVNYINQNTHEDWDTILPYVLFAYRTAIHPATKQSPFYMMFMREARVPADLMFGISSDERCQHPPSEGDINIYKR